MTFDTCAVHRARTRRTDVSSVRGLVRRHGWHGRDESRPYKVSIRSSAISARDAVSRFEKLLLQLLRGASDANFAFDDLGLILAHLCFERDGKDAKPDQVGPVRAMILRNKLGGGE